MPSDLTLPAPEQVAPGSTTEVSGISFNDSFAAGNPGALHPSTVAMSQQDPAPAAAVPAVPTDPVPAAGSTALAMLNDINGAPIGMPLNLNH